MSTNNYIKFMNASGCACTTKAELEHLADSEWCDAIVTKTCTLSKSAGNLGRKYYYSAGQGGGVSLNSNGLENLGIEAYISIVSKLQKRKETILSVTPAVAKKYSKRFQDCGIARVEINVSCPNLGTKALGYELDNFEEYITDGDIVDLLRSNTTVGLKVPPFLDPETARDFYKICNAAGVEWVTTCNSIPNALILGGDFNRRVPVIEPHRGHGGLGGSWVKPIMLANSRWAVENFNGEVWGCGGISSALDVRDYETIGCSRVQIGTFLIENGGDAVTEIKRAFLYCDLAERPHEFIS